MQAKNRIEQRINYLYIIFFSVIGLGVVFSFIGTDFATGISDAVREMNNPAAGSSKYFFEVSNATQNFGYDPSVSPAYNGSISVSARPSKMDVLLTTSGSNISGWQTTVSAILFIASAICYISIFVLLLLTINSLRKSVRIGSFFEKKNILYSRLIGALLIAASVLLSMSAWLEHRFLAPLVTAGNFIVDTKLSFSFGEIVMGIIILFMAEIFAIGYELAQEQKLTI